MLDISMSVDGFLTARTPDASPTRYRPSAVRQVAPIVVQLRHSYQVGVPRGRDHFVWLPQDRGLYHARSIPIPRPATSRPTAIAACAAQSAASYGGRGELGPAEVDEIAADLAGADIVGFSSMTGYADLTRKVITRLRQIDPSTFIIWGGIHPIIHPEDAILADVDAICVGEGEFAFEELYGLLRDGGDHTGVRNFWFKHDGHVIRNGFLPLMTAEEMETMPFPQYGEGEKIYRAGRASCR